MSTTSQNHCPQCGAPLSESAPGGLCPRCVMALNLKTETVFTEDAESPAPASPPPTPAELAPHFPQLEILECLGRGGMGVVYRARQPQLDRFVALKILAPERVTDPRFADRFLREARALAKLNHQNIVTIHDFGRVQLPRSSPAAVRDESVSLSAAEHQSLLTSAATKEGEIYYLLMEFVDGVNLRDLLRAGRMSPKEALAIVPAICEALQYAHDRQIVHRDIKPENILLDKEGRVKIADFGIAKLVEGTGLVVPPSGGPGEASPDRLKPELQTNLTGEQIVGTPKYMSPEQAEKPGEVDHRADIYSLGVVFYEMLTGELPGKELQPPSRKVQIDVRLDEVVLRALEKNPERRYQRASVFKTQVETISATPATSSSGRESARTGPTIAEQQSQPTSAASTDWRRIIWRALVAGFAVWLLVVAVVSVVTFMLPDSYAAQSSVILQRLVPADSIATSAAASEIDEEEMSGEVVMIQSRFILGNVVTNLNLNLEWGRRYGGGAPLQTSATLELLKRRMLVTAAKRMITIRCFDENPEAAARLANAISESFIDWHARAVTSHTKNPRPKPVNGLVVAGAPKLYQVRLVEQATAPLCRIRPNRPLNIVLGVIGGAVLGGIVVAFVGVIAWSRGRHRVTPSMRATTPGVWRLVAGAGAALLLLVGFLVWLAAPKHPDYVMTGRITDSVTGGPVPKATIGVARTDQGEVLREAKADGKGHYKLVWPHDADLLYWRNGARHGVELVFAISAPGYEVQSVAFSRSSPAGYYRRTLDIQLSPMNQASAFEFGPVIERVVADSKAKFKDEAERTNALMQLDLDSGALFSGSSALWAADIDTQRTWMRTNGVDVLGVIPKVNGLVCLDLTAVRVPSEMWSKWSDAAAAGVATKAVQTSIDGTALLSADAPLPSTWFFRTREGSEGLLQITGFTEDLRGVKLRYKLVQDGNVSLDIPRLSPATETLPAGSISFWGLGVSRVLDIYAALAGCELDVESRVKESAATIGYTNITTLTRAEAIAQLENALREQAGVLVKCQGTNRIAVRRGGLEFRWVVDERDTNAPAEWLPDASDASGERKMRLAEEVLLDESAVASAECLADQPERKTIAVRLKQAGAERLAELTAANLGRQLAIAWHGRVLMAPKTVTPITGGTVNITGRMSDAEAKRLLDALNHRAIARSAQAPVTPPLPPRKAAPGAVIRGVTNTDATKTIILTRATNQIVGTSGETQSVSVWTDSTVQPGESLSALAKTGDGQLRKANAVLFTHWQPEKVRTSVGFSWYFGGLLGPGFGQAEADAALAQLRTSICEQPLTLTSGQPLPVFSVTNNDGQVLSGLIEFKHTVPQAEDGRRKDGKPQAVVNVRRFVERFPSMDYSAQVPVGYALRATASAGQVTTSCPTSESDQYHSTWSSPSRLALPELEIVRPGEQPQLKRALPPKVPTAAEWAAQRTALKAQLQELIDQGRITVLLGEPRLLFSVTNSTGGLFQGFLELVGPESHATK